MRRPGATPFVLDMSHTVLPWRQRLLFALLYFSEGAPIGFIWWALPTRLRSEGVAVDQIAALSSLLALPWALKFLWAPAVDAMRARVGYRPVLLGAQAVMVGSLAALAGLDLAADFSAVRAILVLHAFAAATQDVAIDGLAIARVTPAEEGRLNAWMQVGMLSGRAVFGGGALVLVRYLGDSGLLWLLVGCVTGVGLVVLRIKEPPIRERVSGRYALRGILKRRETWLALAVALTVAAGFEAVGGLLGPFLIDSGWSEQRVGLVGFLPSIVAMILGAQAGGVLADRWSPARAASLTCLLVFCAVLGLAAAHRLDWALLPWTLVLYALTGALTAASYALFMALSRGAFAATRFSAFMGATNACEAWAVAAAGALAARFDYGIAFVVVASASLLSLWPLRRLRIPRSV